MGLDQTADALVGPSGAYLRSGGGPRVGLCLGGGGGRTSIGAMPCLGGWPEGRAARAGAVWSAASRPAVLFGRPALPTEGGFAGFAPLTPVNAAELRLTHRGGLTSDGGLVGWLWRLGRRPASARRAGVTPSLTLPLGGGGDQDRGRSGIPPRVSGDAVAGEGCCELGRRGDTGVDMHGRPADASGSLDVVDGVVEEECPGRVDAGGGAQRFVCPWVGFGEAEQVAGEAVAEPRDGRVFGRVAQSGPVGGVRVGEDGRRDASGFDGVDCGVDALVLGLCA